jgi:pimeloyl-ACP methyl ester carboxylesterase
VTSAPPAPLGLRYVASSPVDGLVVAERRVAAPRATFIAVHGGLDRAGSFARLARRLDDFDLVAYDRRGYQGSRDLGPGNLDQHVADLAALARRERSRGRVAFFGHSFGGVVALACAAHHRDLSDLVVAYESPLPWVLARPATRSTPTGDPGHEAEKFFRRVVSHGAWERLSEDERQSRRLDGPALLTDLALLREPAPFDIARLTTPVTYVHGDGALAPYYRDLGEALRRSNPRVEVAEMAHAGHGAHLAHPGQLATLLAEIWERRCASA